MAQQQYQALAAPVLVDSEVVPALSWLPQFPDQISARRSVRSPSLFYNPVLFSTSPVRVSQIPTENLQQYASVLTRVTQLPVETLTQYAAAIRQVRLTQLPIEIIYPFGCHIFVPPLPPACPVALEPGPNTAPCADPAPELTGEA